MERQINIQHDQEELAAALHYPAGFELGEENSRRVPLVVICHGFVGSRIGVDRLFVQAARRLAEDGCMVIRFDYAGCGESTGSYGAEDLESMCRQTRSVLEYGLGCGDMDLSRITLIGHSLGGAVALRTAIRDHRVKHLVLWSAVGYPFHDIVKITGRDVYDASVQRGAADYLGYELTPGFFESLAAIQPFQEAVQFGGDVLVVHGTSDETIPVDYAFLYQKVFWMRAMGRCDKEIVFQADHTYSSGPQREQLLEKTCEWLQSLKKREQDWQHWTI